MSEKGQGEDAATAAGAAVADAGAAAAHAAAGGAAAAASAAAYAESSSIASATGGGGGSQADQTGPENTEPFRSVADDIRDAAEAFPASDAEPQGPPQESAAERDAREQAEQDANDAARDRAMSERDRRRADKEGPQILPPDLSEVLDGSDADSVLEDLPPEENKPVIT